MKRPASDLFALFRDVKVQRNLRALVRFGVVVFLVMALYAFLFQVIMVYAEGQQHSWLTGLYWTLITMSTLGYGDLVFSSDIGRLFTLVVLLSGIMLLFIALPFTFIRFF